MEARLPEFDDPLGSDEEFYEEDELDDLINCEEEKEENIRDQIKVVEKQSPDDGDKQNQTANNGEKTAAVRDIKYSSPSDIFIPPVPAPRKRSLRQQDRIDDDEQQQQQRRRQNYPPPATAPKPRFPLGGVNRSDSDSRSHYFSSFRSNASSTGSARSSRFDHLTPIDQITMQPPSVPLVSVMTWDDRQKKLLDQEEPPTESFSRGNSFRMGIRRSKKDNRRRKPELPVPEVEDSTSKSVSPMSGSEPSSISSPSLMSNSSTNPRAVEQLPPHVRAEELRLDLSSLARSDSRSSISDFKSLETSMEPSLESSYL